MLSQIYEPTITVGEFDRAPAQVEDALEEV